MREEEREERKRDRNVRAKRCVVNESESMEGTRGTASEEERRAPTSPAAAAVAPSASAQEDKRFLRLDALRR